MDKRIADAYHIIQGLGLKGTPKEIPVELFKEQYPGIVKPAKCLEDLPWKPLRRRHFIKNFPQEAERFKLKPEDVAARKNKNFKKEKLKYKWSVKRMDAYLAIREKWDEEDKEDKDKETTKLRCERKQKIVIRKVWAKYNSKNLGQTASEYESMLMDMTKDMVNTIKTLSFINLIFNAKQKHWIACYLNPGSYVLWRKAWSKIPLSAFFFVNKKDEDKFDKDYFSKLNGKQKMNEVKKVLCEKIAIYREFVHKRHLKMSLNKVWSEHRIPHDVKQKIEQDKKKKPAQHIDDSNEIFTDSDDDDDDDGLEMLDMLNRAASDSGTSQSQNEFDEEEEIYDIRSKEINPNNISWDMTDERVAFLGIEYYENTINLNAKRLWDKKDPDFNEKDKKAFEVIYGDVMKFWWIFEKIPVMHYVADVAVFILAVSVTNTPSELGIKKSKFAVTPERNRMKAHTMNAITTIKEKIIADGWNDWRKKQDIGVSLDIHFIMQSFGLAEVAPDKWEQVIADIKARTTVRIEADKLKSRKQAVRIKKPENIGFNVRQGHKGKTKETDDNDFDDDFDEDMSEKKQKNRNRNISSKKKKGRQGKTTSKSRSRSNQGATRNESTSRKKSISKPTSLVNKAKPGASRRKSTSKSTQSNQRKRKRNQMEDNDDDTAFDDDEDLDASKIVVEPKTKKRKIARKKVADEDQEDDDDDEDMDMEDKQRSEDEEEEEEEDENEYEEDMNESEQEREEEEEEEREDEEEEDQDDDEHHDSEPQDKENIDPDELSEDESSESSTDEQEKYSPDEQVEEQKQRVRLKRRAKDKNIKKPKKTPKAPKGRKNKKTTKERPSTPSKTKRKTKSTSPKKKQNKPSSQKRKEIEPTEQTLASTREKRNTRKKKDDPPTPSSPRRSPRQKKPSRK